VRILHVVSSLNVGGAERFVIDLAEEQSTKGHHIAIVSMGNKGEPLEEEVISKNFQLYLSTGIFQLMMLFRQYDVVNIHSSHCLFRSLIASILCSCRIIYTRHNERVHLTPKWKLTYKLAYIKLHKMIFVAEKARLNYLKAYPHFESKSMTVLNGVLPIKVEKHETNKVRLGIVGRFVPLKSQHYLIEAVASMSSTKDMALEFFGDGELLDKNKQLCKKLIPEMEVTFHGLVPNRDSIFKQLDILVVTSETEGLSLAILEAMSSRTPVIASNVGGNPELVTDEFNGFLYEYADIHKLADCIKILTVDAKLRTQYGENGHKRYNDNFSMSICASEYFKAYN